MENLDSDFSSWSELESDSDFDLDSSFSQDSVATPYAIDTTLGTDLAVAASSAVSFLQDYARSLAYGLEDDESYFALIARNSEGFTSNNSRPAYVLHFYASPSVTRVYIAPSPATQNISGLSYSLASPVREYTVELFLPSDGTPAYFRVYFNFNGSSRTRYVSSHLGTAGGSTTSTYSLFYSSFHGDPHLIERSSSIDVEIPEIQLDEVTQLSIQGTFVLVLSCCIFYFIRRFSDSLRIG